MGISAAVNCAYIYIGLIEMTELMNDFKDHLLFYQRFVDNSLGLWNCGIPNAAEQFKLFLARMNNSSFVCRKVKEEHTLTFDFDLDHTT